MEYKVNIVLNNDNNIGNLLSFNLSSNNSLSNKEERKLTIIIADEFGKYQDINEYPNLENLFNEKKSFFEGSNLEELIDGIKKRISKDGISLNGVDLKNVSEKSNGTKYRYTLDNSDYNTVLFSANEFFSAVGFYDKNKKKFVSKSDYIKNTANIKLKDKANYQKSELFGEQLDMVKSLVNKSSFTQPPIVNVSPKNTIKKIERLLVDFIEKIDFSEDIDLDNFGLNPRNIVNDNEYKINISKDCDFYINIDSVYDFIQEYNFSKMYNALREDDNFLFKGLLTDFYFKKADEKYDFYSYNSQTIDCDLNNISMSVPSGFRDVIDDINEYHYNIDNGIKNKIDSLIEKNKKTNENRNIKKPRF
tara:strand:- start:31014 stop:32099 length:1086 start_codon:yes stop_codon:yes gene_type:complete